MARDARGRGHRRGDLDATLIVGAEAARSAPRRRWTRRWDPVPRQPGRRGRWCRRPGRRRLGEGLREPRRGEGRAHVPDRRLPVARERASRPMPVAASPSNEHSSPELMARFTDVAATHPCAWFPTRATAEELATPTTDNRLISEPYTKRMNAFPFVDQAAALVMCSLAVAQEAGVDDRAIFVWSGADAYEVRLPTARPELGRAVGLRAAVARTFAAASGRCRRHRGVRLLLLLPERGGDGRRRGRDRARRPARAHRHRRPAVLRRPGQQLHDARHRDHGREPARLRWARSVQLAGWVHDQARGDGARRDAAGRRVPTGRDRRRPGGDRRQRV